jgi:hypothetical protein
VPRLRCFLPLTDDLPQIVGHTLAQPIKLRCPNAFEDKTERHVYRSCVSMGGTKPIKTKNFTFFGA